MSKKYVMFVDETGTTDNDNEPFSVTGVIFETHFAYSEDQTITTELENKIKAFKTHCFGRHNFTFHLVDIVNADKKWMRQNRIIKKNLELFWKGLPSFLGELPFTVISVTVNKSILNEYYNTPKDAYIVAFAHILKSFFTFISKKNAISARIIVESRDDTHDFKVQKAFFDIYNNGTVHLEINDKLKKRLKGLKFVGKGEPGLEIADLVCNPLSRVKRGLIEVRPNQFIYGTENKIYNAIEEKIFVGKAGHSSVNWGFKEVPIITGT